MKKSPMSKVAAAGFIGALLEWYDFYIFATASALVFGRVFFPSHDPVAGTMAAFGAFASGFLARPLGGILFGHIGDRFGRKTSLVLTLLIIGIGTFLIGVLPGYATIGVAAPVLLVVMRVMQGIGLGGEYGGASLLTIEHSPHGQRGFWGSLPQAASPAGLLLATGVFALISLMPKDQFVAWGWRIPFLLSIVMLVVGMFIRLTIAETPEFESTRGAPRPHIPVMDVLRTHKNAAIFATGARLAETVCGNMIKSFGLTYATVELGLSQESALGALMATSAVGIAVTPFYGWLADRYGARNVYLAGAALAAVLSVPFFWLLGYRTVATLWIGFIVGYNLGPTLMLAVQPTFFSELFATRVRYTGLSIAYQVSAIIGGFTPLVSLALLNQARGRPWTLALTLSGVAVLSFFCALAARRATRSASLPAGMTAAQDA